MLQPTKTALTACLFLFLLFWFLSRTWMRRCIIMNLLWTISTFFKFLRALRNVRWFYWFDHRRANLFISIPIITLPLFILASALGASSFWVWFILRLWFVLLLIVSLYIFWGLYWLLPLIFLELFALVSAFGDVHYSMFSWFHSFLVTHLNLRIIRLPNLGSWLWTI